MNVTTREIYIETGGDCDIIDITPDVAAALEKSEIDNGTVTVFITGSTAGVTTVEYEPGLIQDLKNAFNRLIPQDMNYNHDMRWHDGNGHAHVRASLLGASLVVPFNNRKMELGTWQQIIVIDFDNRPRKRNILLQIMGNG
jgi:secondary thiamine-phosphate synthase enzyme